MGLQTTEQTNDLHSLRTQERRALPCGLCIGQLSLKELVKEVASTEWEAVLIEHELGYDTATLSDIGVDEFNRHVHLERMKDYTPEHLDPMTAAKFEEK